MLSVYRSIELETILDAFLCSLRLLDVSAIFVFLHQDTLGQWLNYGVAKCQGRSAGGGPLGPPTSEPETLKNISAKYNYLKIFITFSLLIEFLMYFVINSSNNRRSLLVTKRH